MKKPTFIAEVKPFNPFGSVAMEGKQLQEKRQELFEVAHEHGDWISIHTDPRWGGSWEWLKLACQMSTKPVLAKGLHTTDYEVERALSCGARFVLVMGRPASHSDTPRSPYHNHILYEVPNIKGLNSLPLSEWPSSTRLVWNARNLTTGELTNAPFAEARMTTDAWLCQASGIRTRADIHPGADAFIVGAHLADFIGTLPVEVVWRIPRPGGEGTTTFKTFEEAMKLFEGYNIPVRVVRGAAIEDFSISCKRVDDYLSKQLSEAKNVKASPDYSKCEHAYVSVGTSCPNCNEEVNWMMGPDTRRVTVSECGRLGAESGRNLRAAIAANPDIFEVNKP